MNSARSVRRLASPIRLTLASELGDVLRQAAALPILPTEQDTEAFRTAEAIVRATRAESALRATLAKRSP
jgi:hypothetical protein